MDPTIAHIYILWHVKGMSRYSDFTSTVAFSGPEFTYTTWNLNFIKQSNPLTLRRTPGSSLPLFVLAAHLSPMYETDAF